jgi:hypothetical protein
MALMIIGRPAARFRESRRAGILEAALAIRLTNGELGYGPGGRLRFNPRKACANQRPMQATAFLFGRRRFRGRIIGRGVRRRAALRRW